jgi:hypothetical protein
MAGFLAEGLAKAKPRKRIKADGDERRFNDASLTGFC